jgi:hypothetical protein
MTSTTYNLVIILIPVPRPLNDPDTLCNNINILLLANIVYHSTMTYLIRTSHDQVVNKQLSYDQIIVWLHADIPTPSSQLQQVRPSLENYPVLKHNGGRPERQTSICIYTDVPGINP